MLIVEELIGEVVSCVVVSEMLVTVDEVVEVPSDVVLVTIAVLLVIEAGSV